jgi:hypothetical protein
LFDPSFFSAGGAHSYEAALAIEHFQALSILDHASLVENRGNVITQDCLRHRNIGNLEYPAAAAIARREADAGRQQTQS